MKILSKNTNQLFIKYSWVLGCCILFFGAYLYLNNKTSLFSKKSEAYGIVYDVTSLRIVRFSGFLYKYKFKHEGKWFFGKTTKSYSGNFENDIYYKVKFITENPKNNEISFDKQYTQKIILRNNKKESDTIYKQKNEP